MRIHCLIQRLENVCTKCFDEAERKSWDDKKLQGREIFFPNPEISAATFDLPPRNSSRIGRSDVFSNHMTAWLVPLRSVNKSKCPSFLKSCIYRYRLMTLGTLAPASKSHDTAHWTTTGLTTFLHSDNFDRVQKNLDLYRCNIGDIRIGHYCLADCLALPLVCSTDSVVLVNGWEIQQQQKRFE